MLDYLVVGLGLAGISFCERLEEQQKSFKVVSNNSQQASVVAGGLYNPVILKRFTLAWKARAQMELVTPFYEKLENKLGVALDHKLPVLRKFASVEEQNLWFEAADKKDLDYFLSTKILANNNNSLQIPNGMGLVNETGRVDTRKLVTSYQKYLVDNQSFISDDFDFNSLAVDSNGVHYKGLSAEKIVFAEGYGLKSNPFFKHLPLNGTKGELLTIQAPELKEGCVIKSSVFIIPLGDDLYRVGATYKWKDKTNTPTEASKNELLEKLDTLINCDYTLVRHVAGVRPTVADRRPLVGRHPKYDTLYVLNGFGSRGVMTAPYASQQLFDFIENGRQLDREMDIARFG